MSDQESNRLTPKQYAAILLRIPRSGEKWLDEMIVEAKNREIAVQVVSGMLATKYQDPHADHEVLAIAEPIIKELQKR